MITALNNIKDARQLHYVLEAIEKADYELAIARHRLMFLFPDTRDAYNALTLARDPMRQFAQDARRIIAESESLKEMNR